MTDETRMTVDLQNLMPFAKACGIRLLTATPAEVRGEMDWAPEICTTAGGACQIFRVTGSEVMPGGGPRIGLVLQRFSMGT